MINTEAEQLQNIEIPWLNNSIKANEPSLLGDKLFTLNGFVEIAIMHKIKTLTRRLSQLLNSAMIIVHIITWKCTTLKHQ